jgi:hypothetical protein
MDDNNADLDGVLVNVPVKVAKSKKEIETPQYEFSLEEKTKKLF